MTVPSAKSVEKSQPRDDTIETGGQVPPDTSKSIFSGMDCRAGEGSPLVRFPVMAANGPLWTLMDETESREYHVFPWYETDDEGLASQPVLADVAVIEALHLDEGGGVVRREVGPAARRYDEQAWRILQKDRGLRELMETVVSADAAPAVEGVRSTDEAQAAILESLRDLLGRRRAGRGLRDVS